MASIQKRPDGKWRARYRDETGKEHAKHFRRKTDAQQWLDEETAALVTGSYVPPQLRRMTVSQWCETWLDGYTSKAPGTVRQARSHLKAIREEFGDMPLGAVRPSHVKAWVAKLVEEGAASTAYAKHSRLAQIMADAVHDGLIPKSPCSRRTSPPMGQQRPFVSTDAQVWALYEAFPVNLRAAVLLGAFAGLRVAEIAGLRVADVDFMRGVINPVVQYPAKPLKTKMSMTPIPVPSDLLLLLAESVRVNGGDYVVANAWGRQAAPHVIEAAFRHAKKRGVADKKRGIDELPEAFRFHDLRHYFASMLIRANLDVKTVQTMLRHASAKTTLDTYSHMFPDREESARAAIAAVINARADSLRTSTAN